MRTILVSTTNNNILAHADGVGELKEGSHVVGQAHFWSSRMPILRERCADLNIMASELLLSREANQPALTEISQVFSFCINPLSL
jgi:hypothetical protein